MDLSMTGPSLAECVSEVWPPCIAATLRRTLVDTVGCAFLQPTRQVTHTRTDSAQKESNCDGGKLSLGLGQYAFEPRAVSSWPCSTMVSMAPQPLTSALPVFGQGILLREAPHQPQTASSAASQCCQPCMHPILLFDVARLRRSPLRRAWCATVAGKGTNTRPRHPTRLPCLLQRGCPDLDETLHSAPHSKPAHGCANSTPSVDLSYLTNFLKSRSRAGCGRHHQLSCHAPSRQRKAAILSLANHSSRTGCVHPHTKRLPVAGLGIPRKRYSLKASYNALFTARLVAVHPDHLVTTRAMSRARSRTLRSSKLMIALSTGINLLSPDLHGW